MKIYNIYCHKILLCRNEKKFESETEEEEETAQEKRLRLAKKYLHEIEEEGIIFKISFFLNLFYFYSKRK